MWVLSITPHFYGALYLTSKSHDLPKFDNVSPRDFLRKVQNQEKQSAVRHSVLVYIDENFRTDDSRKLSPPLLSPRRSVPSDDQVVQKYLRAEAAQQNSFEQWGIFASAVVVGNMARLPTKYMNLFAGGYLLSRALYNVRLLFLLPLSSCD